MSTLLNLRSDGVVVHRVAASSSAASAGGGAPAVWAIGCCHPATPEHSNYERVDDVPREVLRELQLAGGTFSIEHAAPKDAEGRRGPPICVGRIEQDIYRPSDGSKHIIFQVSADAARSGGEHGSRAGAWLAQQLLKRPGGMSELSLNHYYVQCAGVQASGSGVQQPMEYHFYNPIEVSLVARGLRRGCNIVRVLERPPTEADIEAAVFGNYTGLARDAVRDMIKGASEARVQQQRSIMASSAAATPAATTPAAATPATTTTPAAADTPNALPGVLATKPAAAKAAAVDADGYIPDEEAIESFKSGTLSDTSRVRPELLYQMLMHTRQQALENATIAAEHKRQAEEAVAKGKAEIEQLQDQLSGHKRRLLDVSEEEAARDKEHLKTILAGMSTPEQISALRTVYGTMVAASAKSVGLVEQHNSALAARRSLDQREATRNLVEAGLNLNTPPAAKRLHVETPPAATPAAAAAAPAGGAAPAAAAAEPAPRTVRAGASPYERFAAERGYDSERIGSMLSTVNTRDHTRFAPTDLKHSSMTPGIASMLRIPTSAAAVSSSSSSSLLASRLSLLPQ